MAMIMNKLARGLPKLRTLCSKAYSSCGSRNFSGVAMSQAKILPVAFRHPCLLLKNQCSTQSGTSKALLDFLHDEIQLEKESHKGSLPSIDGFEVTANQANVVLTKKNKKEILTVEFSVNAEYDIPSDAEDVPSEPQGATTAEPEDQPLWQTPQPVLQVKLRQEGGASTLAFRCQIVDDLVDAEAAEQAGGEEDSVDGLLTIEEVALLDGEGTEWDSNTYTVSASSMDGTLYDMLVTMLADRGVTDGLVRQVMQFNEDYEHGMYIKFLEGLQDFVGSDKSK